LSVKLSDTCIYQNQHKQTYESAYRDISFTMNGVSDVPLIPIVHEDDPWFEWTEIPGGPRVMVRFVERNGRYHVEELRLLDGVSAERLRSVPVGRIEAAGNALMHGSGAARLGVPARIPEELRSNAVRGYPDRFYEAVAAAYHTLAPMTPRPVVALAEANDVPVTTAQRWVREARVRGMLPPGRQGTSG
jgi:hypothetical protein